MTTIGIYKPLWKTLFHSEDEASVFVNPDIKNFVLLLAKNHEVVLFSETDLLETGNPRYSSNLEEECDILILCNGRLYLKEDEMDEKVKKQIEEIHKLFRNKVPQYHFITDLKIIERNEEVLKNINLINVSQSKKVGRYGHLDKIFLYKNKIDFDIKQKKDKLVYVGNERNGNRNDLIIEYLLNSGYPTEIYGKWKNTMITQNSFFKGPISCKECEEKLKESKYSLVISDVAYRKKNFITPRYFECLLSGTIPFVDINYDKDELLIKQNDFRVVKNYDEMQKKIRFLERTPSFYEMLVEKQTREVKEEYLNGEFQIKILNEVLKCALE